MLARVLRLLLVLDCILRGRLDDHVRRIPRSLCAPLTRVVRKQVSDVFRVSVLGCAAAFCIQLLIYTRRIVITKFYFRYSELLRDDASFFEFLIISCAISSLADIMTGLRLIDYASLGLRLLLINQNVWLFVIRASLDKAIVQVLD